MLMQLLNARFLTERFAGVIDALTGSCKELLHEEHNCFVSIALLQRDAGHSALEKQRSMLSTIFNSNSELSPLPAEDLHQVQCSVDRWQRTAEAYAQAPSAVSGKRKETRSFWNARRWRGSGRSACYPQRNFCSPILGTNLRQVRDFPECFAQSTQG